MTLKLKVRFITLTGLDYQHSYVMGSSTHQAPTQNRSNFTLHKNQTGQSIVKTVKLKAGQHIIGNEAFTVKTFSDKPNFLIDYNLSKLSRLL